MVRIFSVFLASLALAASITGCSALLPSSREQEPSEQPYDGATYYNGYLGLAVTVPDGWYEEEINAYNLTKNPRDSADLYSLDLYDYGDGGYAIDLISMQNDTDSSADAHAELMLYADYYPGTDEEEYLGWISDYILDKADEEYYYEIEDIGGKTINGRRYTRFLAKVSFSDGSTPYYEEYYVSTVNGAFFVAYINYWSDSRRSKAAAYSALESVFSLEDTYGAEANNPIQSV